MYRTEKEMNALENKIKLVKALKDMPLGTQFRACDIGVSGATLKACNIPVVGNEEYWYQIDENTMKKGTRKIYVNAIQSNPIERDLFLIEMEIQDNLNAITRLINQNNELQKLALKIQTI